MRSLSKVLKYSDIVIGSDAYIDTDASERLRLIRDEHRAQDTVRRTIDMTMTQAAAGKAKDVITEASRQAQEIIERAREEAVSILENARNEGFDQGRIEGFEQGVQQGAEQIRAFENEKIQELQEFCSKYEEQLIQRLDSINTEALEFAFSLASKIIGVEIDRDDSAFLKLFEDAAAHIGEAETITLKVDEKCYGIATRCRDQMIKCISGLKKINIEQSGDAYGTCVLETPRGNVDSSVDTQLARAAEVVKNI